MATLELPISGVNTGIRAIGRFCDITFRISGALPLFQFRHFISYRVRACDC